MEINVKESERNGRERDISKKKLWETKGKEWYEKCC